MALVGNGSRSTLQTERADDGLKSDVRNVVLHSSDEVEFVVRRANIKSYAGAFPEVPFGEVLYLQETASVVEVLYRFLHPRRCPDLDDKDFDQVMALGKAAEKCEVFAAMSVCQLRLRQFLPEHASEILVYGLTYKYQKMVEEATPYVILCPLTSVVEELPEKFVSVWVRYHETWKGVLKRALQYVVKLEKSADSSCSHVYVCSNCQCALMAWFQKLENITSVPELMTALRSHRQAPPQSADFPTCGDCPKGCQHMADVADICIAGIKDIPSFGKFIKAAAKNNLNAPAA